MGGISHSSHYKGNCPRGVFLLTALVILMATSHLPGVAHQQTYQEYPLLGFTYLFIRHWDQRVAPKRALPATRLYFSMACF